MSQPINIGVDECAPWEYRVQAWRGDMDLDIAIGTGATVDEAMQDLYDQEDFCSGKPDDLADVRGNYFGGLSE